MLVLTRKIGERVMIGDHITIEVLELNNTRVRLGINAPPQVTIRRKELPERHGPPAASAGTAEDARDGAPPSRPEPGPAPGQPGDRA